MAGPAQSWIFPSNAPVLQDSVVVNAKRTTMAVFQTPVRMVLPARTLAMATYAIVQQAMLAQNAKLT